LNVCKSRKREDQKAEILEGHQSTALCHIGNISWRLGQKASPADVRAELAKLRVHENVLETFERTEKHLLSNDVSLDKTPLTLGAYLRIDGDSERFAGNQAANDMLSREYRKPFIVPSEAEIG
jgi:hypothetical protein